MKDVFDRLKIELEDLREKSLKLKAFLKSSKANSILKEEKDLLIEQDGIFDRLIEILTRRIDLMSAKLRREELGRLASEVISKDKVKLVMGEEYESMSSKDLFDDIVAKLNTLNNVELNDILLSIRNLKGRDVITTTRLTI